MNLLILTIAIVSERSTPSAKQLKRAICPTEGSNKVDGEGLRRQPKALKLPTLENKKLCMPKGRHARAEW